MFLSKSHTLALASSFPNCSESLSHPPAIHRCKITRVQKQVTITSLSLSLIVIYKLYGERANVPRGRPVLPSATPSSVSLASDACAADLKFLLLQGTQDISHCCSELVIVKLVVHDAKQTAARD